MLCRPQPQGPFSGLALLGLLWLVAPAGAWYKHAASPRYHTVGRASGLLMGVRRSPYLWRRQAEEAPPARSAPRWLRLQLLLRQGARSALERQPDLDSAGAAGRSAALAPQGRRGSGSSIVGQRRGPAWAARCPPACRQEAPWPGSPDAAPQHELLLQGARRKKGQPPGAAQLASVFEPEI